MTSIWGELGVRLFQVGSARPHAIQKQPLNKMSARKIFSNNLALFFAIYAAHLECTH